MGNTRQLAEAFCKGARDAGHEVKLISLMQYQVNGCLGCNACRFGKPCVQKDDFDQVAALIAQADLIAFASPLYFWTISARMKALIERFYSLAKEDADPPLDVMKPIRQKNVSY